MGIFDKLFKRNKNIAEPAVMKNQKPKFVRRDQQGNSIYEIYAGTDAESAKAFLLTKQVDKKLYYIVVETPEGNWGMDIQGLYLERLLPWQTENNSTNCEGSISFMSWSQFGLEMAAKGLNDNFIAKVQCGKCEEEWLDGIRYQNTTLVRCPKCKVLNNVDSRNIQVYLV